MDYILDKSDVNGIVSINSNDSKIVAFFMEFLTKKDVLNFNDFNDLTNEKDIDFFKDENMSEHAILEFNSTGDPRFEDVLNNLKENLCAIASKDKRLENVLNSQWSLIFDCTDDMTDGISKDGLYGICNKIEGFREEDFEVVRIR